MGWIERGLELFDERNEARKEAKEWRDCVMELDKKDEEPIRGSIPQVTFSPGSARKNLPEANEKFP